MARLRDYPISHKLTWMNMAVSALALLLACAGFVAIDVATFRQNFTLYISTQARIVEVNCITALVFDDPEAARRTLSALSRSPNILAVTIFDLEGRSFASAIRDPSVPGAPTPYLSPLPEKLVWREMGELRLLQTISFEDKPVGYVYIRASSQTLTDRIRRYLGIAAVVLAISLAAAFAVSWLFGRAVADPIAHLAEVAGKVSREKNYSVRAEAPTSQDEVAVLFDSFNDMLEQIQERDSALQRAHDQLEARVQERTAELKELSGRLMNLQDEERRHIARELHDSTGQVVAALGMNLAVLRASHENWSANASKALEESVRMVKELSSELRTLSHLLHPPLLDVAGLESALKWYVNGFAERSGIRAVLELPPDLGRLPREVETAVFRIVQESLTNVHRHANSETASVRITQNGRRLRLEIRDEGTGMPEGNDPTRTSLGIGIQGMRERASRLGGELSIRSDESGTTIVAVLPSSSGD